MSWKLEIPYRDRDDPLDAQALDELPGALAGEDRDIARHVLLEARLAGAETVGDALDGLETASPAERRRTLDRAREAAGLPNTATVEFEALQRSLVPSERDEYGRAFQRCHAPNCDAVPLDATGLPVGVRDRRWWCPAHRNLAAPGDAEPPEEWTVDGAMSLVPGPTERGRMVRADERRKEARRRDREGREAETKRVQKLRDSGERTRRRQPGSVRNDPDLRSPDNGAARSRTRRRARARRALAARSPRRLARGRARGPGED